MATQLNGVNLDQLIGTVNVIKEQPEIAKFQFRTNTKWLNGGHCQTSIQSFYGAGNEDSSRDNPFIIEGDEPPVLLGENHAPNAVEILLHALASCISVGFAYNAAAQGIKLENLELSLEGDIDLHGFLGLSESVRPGYENIQLNCKVKADTSEEQLKELWEYVQKTSPVLDIIRNPVPVSVNLESI